MSSKDDIFNQLVLNGGLKFVGSDPDSGEALYVRTEMLKNIDPKLDEDLSSYFFEMAMKLWQNGFIDMDVTMSDPVITLADNSFDIKKIESMDKDEKLVLQQIIKILLDKK
jgi:hypothetical protein